MTRAHLLLGCDRTSITPTEPIRLAGFASRAGLPPAATSSAPLRLRTLTFADPDGDADGGTDRAVLVAADLLWWGTDVADRLRRELADRHGLSPDAVMLHATHNHSGPQTSHRFVPSLGMPDRRWIDRLCQEATESVDRALAAMVPARVERTETRSDMSVERRWARTGGAIPAAPIDDTVTVLRFSAAEGRTVALLVHFACHPVVHHGNVVTSDFPGATMDALERRHPGAVAVYTQGCCGDVNPARYAADGTYSPGAQAEVDLTGERLAAVVQRALDAGTRPVGESAHRLRADGWTIDLPVATVPNPAELRNAAARDGVVGEWARLLSEHPARVTPTVSVRLSRLRLADDLTLLGLSGEPVSAYGLQVAADSGGTVLPIGYTNGMTGYLVTARQLAEGGYEPTEAPYYFGMPGPLSPDAEPELRHALRDAVGRSLDE